MRSINLFRWIVLCSFVVVLFTGIGPGNAAQAAEPEPVCYQLAGVIDGGVGSGITPDPLYSPDCPKAAYLPGTVVTLTANPDRGAEVLAWRGTDDDSSTALTNQVTMTADREVGVTYLDGEGPDPISADFDFAAVNAGDKKTAPPKDGSVGAAILVDDNFEHNDFLVDYYDLTYDEQTWLTTLDPLGGIQWDEDWYRIWISPGFERLLVDMRHTYIHGDIDMEVYSAAGQWLAGAYSMTDDEYIDYTVPETGVYYYIKVYYSDVGNAYDLWWDDVPPPAPAPGGDGYENDDLLTNANWIINNDVQVHSIDPVLDDDWVKFTVDGNQAVVIQTTGKTGVAGTDYDTWMELHGATYGLIESNDDSGHSFHARIDRTCLGDLLPAGTYHVLVRDISQSYTIPSYNLSLMVYDCLGAFNGGARIHANQPIVAIGRPHNDTEIMAYSGQNAGAYENFLPMLFNDIWEGGWDSTFTLQNTGTGPAEFEMGFFNAKTGNLDCVIYPQHLTPNGVRTYDVTNLPQCTGGAYVGGYLPTSWFGGAAIASDQPLVAIARPRIYGTDVVTYNAFTSGSSISSLPMLFRDIWGYESAFYVQNLDPGPGWAAVYIDFYDNQGNFTCTYTDPLPLPSYATRGYWMENIDNSNCLKSGGPGGGTGFLPGGWAGAALVGESSGTWDIVAIARPHMGSEVAAYNGFNDAALENYLPMLFREKWGYNSAIYVQNIATSLTSSVSIDFYDTAGNKVCTYDDPDLLPGMATRGYWLPFINCTVGGSFPSGGWAGSATIRTSGFVEVVGRPHLSDGQVVAYNGFQGGGVDIYLPQLYRSHGSNQSALYIQNLNAGVPALVQIEYYDEDSGYFCSMVKEVGPNAAGAIWLAFLEPAECIP